MSNWAKKAVSTAMVATSIASSMPAGAAVDVFIKMEIKGESLSDAHKGEIDVMSWSWGTTGGASEATHLAAAGMARGQQTPQISQLTITKKVDASSANLLKYALSGKHLPDATLSIRKAGVKAIDFLIIKMKDVAISAIDESGQGTGDTVVEKVTFSFVSFDFSYAAQKPDGSLDAPQRTSYDLKTNKAQ